MTVYIFLVKFVFNLFLKGCKFNILHFIPWCNQTFLVFIVRTILQIISASYYKSALTISSCSNAMFIDIMHVPIYHEAYI